MVRTVFGCSIEDSRCESHTKNDSFLSKHRLQARVRSNCEIFPNEGTNTPYKPIPRLFADHSQYEGFFVRSFGWYEDAKYAYIAMEYFELGDLESYLEQPLQEWETQQVTYQLLEGLEQLHLNGYAHRDLKPAVSVS